MLTLVKVCTQNNLTEHFPRKFCTHHEIQTFCKFIRTTNYPWLETNVSVQHPGRSPGLKIITYTIFPGKDFQGSHSLFPVIYRLLLPNYGDEFVQDFHLFPFSPKLMFLYIVLTPECIIFNLLKYTILLIKVKHILLSVISIFGYFSESALN